MRIGTREFDTQNKTYIMGILNVTPDSFSDGGKFNKMDQAMEHVNKMVKAGADIIDVGGESTKPGYIRISDEEEIERISSVIEKIKSTFDIPVSLDTYKSHVAKAGIAAGADMINDVWGLKHDKDLGRVIAESGVACCLMHNREKPDYKDFLQEIISDLSETMNIARDAGIDYGRIILDPGVGFGKTYENNLQIIQNLQELHSFGQPLLLGTSRKSVIGLTLDLPVYEREEGTIVTTALAVMNRCAFVRVHDVEANRRAILMAMAIRDVKL